MTAGSETRTVDPLPSPLRPLEPGTLLGGRYRLGPVLGRGGFGVVQRARDLRLEQDVALKLIHPARLEGTSLERLRREVKVTRDADSERLVTIFDLAQADGHVFLVMELVEGRSLRQVLEEEGPLTVERTIELASELLRALGDLHAHGVLHRDVKPANVLVDNSGRLRLADFGLARPLYQESYLTASNAMLGTAAYLFPERGRELTPAADLYSFGVVLFEMLTGRRPFVADDPVDLLKAHLQESPPKARRLRPEVPAWLADIVERLLEKRPEDRYQGAEEVLEAFDKRARRRSWSSWLLIAAAALLALSFVLSRQFETPQHKRTADESRRPPPGRAFSGPDSTNLELDNTVTVRAQDGSVLATLPEADAAGVFRLGGRRWVAVVRDEVPEGGGPPPYTLTLYDPKLEIARVDQLPLEVAAAVFESQGFASTYGSFLKVLDVDEDGNDELFIGLLHTTQYPSTTLLYEPARQRSREIFRATGHHYTVGVADFTGDGRKDVLIAGINNRLGYASYLAALEIVPPVGRPGAGAGLDSNPTSDLNTGPPRNLIFYAIAPLGGCISGPDCIEIDIEKRRIRWRHSLRSGPIELDFQGLRTDVLTTASPADRVAARRQAYRSYRRAAGSERQGDFYLARSSYLEALAESRLAGEPDLSAWIEMCAGVAAIADDSTTPEQETLSSSLSRLEPVAAAELAFEAGRKLHRLGRTEAAMVWYQYAFGTNHLEDERTRWELVQSMLLAHLENGRVDAAGQLLDDYHRRYPLNRSYQDPLRAYLDWRAGGPPRQVGVNRTSPDLSRYWALELRHLSAPSHPNDALAELDREMPLSSETRGALLAWRAELLVTLGRSDDARMACDQAREWYATLGPRWIPARLLKSDYERRCAEVLASTAPAEAFTKRPGSG